MFLNIGTQPPVSSEEEDLFTRLAADPNLYERIAKSIAPSIFGAVDIKKAIACLLFGGSRKLMPDGLCRRGDINVLMLGDPGTAKSQLLKFVEKVAPIAVYTSGKGSSAAGLTASVSRDPVTVSLLSCKEITFQYNGKSHPNIITFREILSWRAVQWYSRMVGLSA